MSADGTAVILRKLTVAETKAKLRSKITSRNTLTICDNVELEFNSTAGTAINKRRDGAPEIAHKDVSYKHIRSTKSLSALEDFSFPRYSKFRRSVSLQGISEDNNDIDDNERIAGKAWITSCLVKTFYLFTFVFVMLTLLLAVSYIDVLKQSYDVDNRNIFKMNKLLSDVNSKVFGQNVAIRLISSELKDLECQNPAPYILVLHFIGSTGSGKTLVTRILSSHFISIGANVHWHVSSTLSTSWLTSRIVLWTTNVFVFDDYQFDEYEFVQLTENFRFTLESMTPDILNSTKFVFVTSSNRMVSEIVDVALKAELQQLTRNELTEQHFTFISSMNKLTSAFKIKIKHSFIPFLPLTKYHVALCVKQNMDSFDNGAQYYNSASISSVLSALSYFPEENPIFSKFGCKKLPLIRI